MSKIERENKYLERQVRWSDKTRDQLSFFNNLLLTLSVGFLSFGYKEIKIDSLSINLCSPQISFTFDVFSFIIMAISIYCGLVVALNRLFDYRLTSHINQIRYWTFKYSDIILDDNSTTIKKTIDYHCLA